MKITSATLEKYNANNRGKNVGDCVKRSMSLAFDISYSEMGKLLNEQRKKSRAYAWNQERVFSPLIQELGGSPVTDISNQAITLEEFVDNRVLPGDTYILLVGKKPGLTSHLVCVRDGKIWDSWDSRNYYVTRYWTVDSTNHKQIQDIKDQLSQIYTEFGKPVLMAELEKWMSKKMWDGSYSMNSSQKAYNIKTKWFIVLDADELITKERRYSFEIAFPFEPTMDYDEACEFVKKTAKTRMYDRMYAIADQEKKLVEEYKMRSQLGQEDGSKNMLYYMTDQERKFYKSLPGWARALIKYVDVERPNYYSDSYSVKMKKLPSDDKHPDITQVYFNGFNADEIKYKIDRYGKTHELDGIDYYYDN